MIWLLNRMNFSSNAVTILCFIVFCPTYLFIYNSVGPEQPLWFSAGGNLFVIAMRVGLASLFIYLLLVNALGVVSHRDKFGFPSLFTAMVNMLQDMGFPMWKKVLFFIIPLSWLLWTAAFSTFISLWLARTYF